ncbi:MAG TPA: FHA domain-containing protein [Gammaproteobacteria bacterium]|nr:FHA domain-containing protein [Gammaproteobacteria bacterium]
MLLLLALAGPGSASEPRNALGAGIQPDRRAATETRLRSAVPPEPTAARINLRVPPASEWTSVGRAAGSGAVLLLKAAVAREVNAIAAAVPTLSEARTAIETPAPSAAETGVPGLATESPPSSAVSDPVRPFARTVWRWYVLLPGALLIALSLFLLLAARTRRRQHDDLASTAPSKLARPLALLESQDGSNQRHAITRTAYRIGRHSDNDLTIRDASISRQHAEIHRRRNGSFTITDLDSVNGVFVNQKKIDSVTLTDGDLIEIGDKSFRFRMKGQGEPTGGETPAQHNNHTVTRLPDAAKRR